MPPVETYKIQLEQIQSTQADKPIKDLASRVLSLISRIKNLERVLERSAGKPREGISIPSVDLTVKRLDAIQKSVVKLDTTIQQLKGLKDIPAAIKKVVSTGREVIKGTRDPRDRELTEAIKGLVNVYRRIEKSEAYKTGREAVLKNIGKALEKLTTKQTRSIDDLNKTVKDLSKSVGVSPTGGGRRVRNPELDREVKLFGKALKDMGTEFEKIKRELKDKIVVAIDLETSQAKRIGKEVATEFISQIAYQKGTIQQILAGKAERGKVFVKPPKGVETEAQYKRLIGNIGKVEPIPLEKLKKEGIEATEAMKKVADVLKNAEAVIGHNIAQFDIGVLEQHFKKTGVKIESEVNKFIDTLRLARENFPQRLSTPTRRRPFSLESFDKDFKIAGIEAKNLGGSLHEASYDVDVTVNLLKALDGSSKELAAAQGDLSNTLSKISETVERATKTAAKSMEKASQKMDKMAAESDILSEAISETEAHMGRMGKSVEKATLEIEDLAKVRSSIQANIFKPQLIQPRPAAEPFAIAGPPGAARSEKTAVLLGDLARSLDRLQNNIVKSLERGMRSGVEILKNEAGKSFQLAAGQAEWELKIVDVRGLRRALATDFREFAAPEAPAGEVIETFKKAFIKKELGVARTPEAMAESVYKEIGSLTAEMARTMGRNVEQLFKAIRQQSVTVSDIAKQPELTDLFKGVALEARAQRELTKKFIKRLAIPAARIGPEGGVSVPTKYGAERALANFATITTGLEKLAQEMKVLGAPPMEFERLMRDVTKAPLRPVAGTVAEAETQKLASILLKRVIELGGRKEVAGGYQKAITLRGLEQGDFTKEQAKEFVSSMKAALDPLPLEELMASAKELRVTSLDVAKALDEISFENFYDILDKMLQAGKVPYLQRQAANIVRFDRNMRNVSGTINDLLGLQPLVDPGRPKRKLYDEQSLKVLSKATDALRPEEQKKHIVDVGLLWKDLAVRAEKLGEGIFTGKPALGRPVATSLDLSDAASSKLKQFNENMVTNLKSLDKTMIGMNLADIRGTAPFKDFSSIQRQLSYVSSAIAGGVPGGGRFEAPALLSAKEQRVIESGRHGTAETGLNVLTELRNTAQTFEDQIVISGRLAKSFTQITRRLVKPAATLVEGKRITEIEPGVKRITPRAARLVTRSEEEFKRVLSEVTDQFQEILGVPQRYRGRADIAEVGKEIENVMREHRGKTIEVQTAKITETFLNFFGRKLSTRFGTKGVSVTPRYGELPKGIGSIKDVSKFIQEGFKAGVAPGPGLGAAKIPKSVGRLLSEMMEDAMEGIAPAGIELHNKLIESGNKFIIELFKDAAEGLVTEKEAKKQAQLFADVSKVYKEVFKTELPTGVAGIREIRGAHEERFGERAGFEFKPIEARISSRGIAKRGLMPEVLEGIVNNLIGTTAGVTTLQDEVSKGALTETKKARTRLNEYMYELGFRPFKDLEGITKRLKLEMPNIDPDTINKLKAFEEQFSVYTDVVNEFGEQMQSFVAPKFLQVIEEPHLFPEWSQEQIGKGLKGARLDFQSFAAMAGVFGEGSQMMQELAASTAITAQEGWELLRAFQMLDPAMQDMRESMLKGLRAVSLKDVAAFEKATGTVEELKGTIFDIGKFPTPFKLKLPTTEKGGEKAFEELYIPGPALRGTYQEELLGAQAPTNVARYLDNLIDAAKKVEEILDAAAMGGLGLSEEFQSKFAFNIRAELTKSLTDTIKRFQQIEKAGPTPQNAEFMQQTISGFKQALSETREVAPIYQEGGAITERGAVEEFERKFTGQFSKVLGRVADILIGPDPASLRKDIGEIKASLKSYRETGRVPERFETPYYQNILQRFSGDFEAMMQGFSRRTQARAQAKPVFDIELEAGNLDAFAKSVGISVQESLKEALEQRKQSLSKAKIAYFRELGESVFGKKKGIEEVFFQRITPAVTGKAISAIADKTKDLKGLLDALQDKYIIDLDIPGLPALVEDLEKIAKAHSEYVIKARKLGLPVLKEGEIGLPPEMAAKIKVRTGVKDEIETTLADLIAKQSETFVESIRYPFTGTLSVQPHRARLLEQALGKQAIAVPGAPGFARAGQPEERRDIGDLIRIIGTLREFIGVAPAGTNLPEGTLTLLQRREQAWAEGTLEGAEKAHQLTNAIEGLLKVVNDATPSFVNLEQKLDFDGDALFVHTGQVEASRAEIKKHFEALGDDVTGVRTLFRSVFTAVKESDVATLSEMANIFGKKHPKEKGFEFLTRPFLQEEMKNLNLSEVMEGLFTYTPAAGQLKAGTEEWRGAVREWSKGFVTKDILPEVFGKLGVEGPTGAAYREKVGVSGGIPAVTETTSGLEKNISRLAGDLVRRQLWEKRYADAITGQLFKLHTGQTVEGISRVARVSELETGFGKGLAGTGRKARPSPGFLQRFPEESIALGGRPVQEFANRVNEIMRFVIQKGMDVKHAGVEAVGQQIITNIGKKGGTEFIKKAMMEAADQWDELADFNAQIENEVRLRLGKFSTEELRREIQRFEPDVDIAQLTGISREDIVQRIIKHVDITATFEELGRQIQRQAVIGLSKSLERKMEELPTGPRKVRMARDVQAAGGVERFATEQISQEFASETGISLQRHITTNLQPLYRMRTSMETLATAASRTGMKVEPTKMLLPQMGAEGLARDLENAQKAAHVLSQALAQTGTVKGGGVHKFLVLSAIQQRYKELEELQKLERASQGTVGRMALPFTGIVEANKLAVKIFQEAGAATGLGGGGTLGPIPQIENLEEFFDKLGEVQRLVRSRVKEISKLAGLMPLIPEEEALIGRGAVEKYGTKPFETIKGVLERGALERGEQIVPEDLEQRAGELATIAQDAVAFQTSMIEQLRRVTEVMKTVPQQKEYLERAFPEIKFEEGIARVSAAQKEAVQRHEDYTQAIEDWHRRTFPTERTGELRETIRTFQVPTTLAGEDLKRTAVRSADELTTAIDKSLVSRKRDALKFLEAQAAGPAAAREVPLHEVFRASAVHGGGMFGGGSQLEGITSEMVGAPKGSQFLLEATALRGTAIHRRKQREFLAKFPTAEIEKPIEDLANRITGHIDVLYEEGGQKIVADIKTVYSTAQFKRLQEISDEVEQRNITIQQKLDELKSKEPTSAIEKNVIRRLENYISQVNVYLQGVEGAIGELVIISTFDPKQEVTIPIGKFDPARFKSDLGRVQEARDRVTKLLALVQAGQPIPEELFADMPKVYEFISKELERVGPKEFVKGLPTRPLGEAQQSSREIIGRLTEEQDRLFEKISKDYLDIFQSLGGPGVAERPLRLMFAAGAGAAGAPPAAPPPPTPPGGPGDGFDDEELRKRIQKILARMERGIKPEVPEIHNLIQTLDEALEGAFAARERDDELLANALENVADTIRASMERMGASEETYREIFKLYQDLDKAKRTGAAAETDFTRLRTPDIERISPDRPEAVHKNLRALYEAALRIHRLAGVEEIQRFGPDIATLLGEAAKKGPVGDITGRISDAISQLPPEKRGGMRRIWMFYKSAVSEYFLNRLDALREEIEKETGTPEGRRALIEYEQTIERFLGNIRTTIGRTSDIFTQAGPSGRKTEFVDPELARLTGVYKSPKQIEETIRQTTPMRGELKPIMDVLVGDLDVTLLDDMATPLQKIQAAFSMMTKEDKGMKAILEDADLFRRIGHEAIKAWDFEALTKGITELRAAMQAYHRLQIGAFGGLTDYTETIRKNVEDTIRYLRRLEQMFAPVGAKSSPLGLAGVPSFLDPQTQTLLHRRNIAQAQQYFKTPEAAGGPESGQAFSYRYQIVDPATKQTLSSVSEEFRKIGETSTKAGGQVGLFTQQSKDLVKSFQERRGLGQAFGRVIRWGLASRTVYGMVNALQSVVSTISDVELGIAVLRQVMSPMQTDFRAVTDAALGFAKQFGLPIRQVIDSMRVFAQQGLSQQEVIDRTNTSMLAANVTTLATTEATEAITAAMKVYGTEGQSTIKFLDAWTEVEARHAITSADLANALKKSAAVAKTSGVTFDQLNAIITGIGETTRQTGKEIGTGLRFIFRRIQAEKAPKVLAQVGIPVIGPAGELRSAFNILGDLAGAWEELSNAQRLNIATAIGGRRHYNALIVLMDHWQDVSETLAHSISSKGAAERRNMIVMETYAKRLQQVRGALDELQVQFGRFALPAAKTILTGLKAVLETIANIPSSIKIAMLAFTGLFALIAKGQTFMGGMIDRIKAFISVFSDFGSQFMKQFKIGIFETFGKLPTALATIDVTGLSTIDQAGKGIQDFESIIGKAAFALAQFGRGWNSVMSEIAYTGTATSETLAKAFGKTATGLASFGIKVAARSPVLGGILKVMAEGAEEGEKGLTTLGTLFGIPARALAKWSQENASFVASVGPLAGSIAALIPIAGGAAGVLSRLALSADDYEKSLAGLRRLQSSELANITDLATTYDRLEKSIEKANAAREPEAVVRAVKREEYVSPLLLAGRAYDESRDLANSLAKTNISLIEGFDKFGNAIVKPTANLKEYFRVLKEAKIKETAETEVKALEKFAEELTNAGSASAKFRSELKKFAKEIPGVGPLIAKQIKVSPAQGLKEAVADVNKILEARAEFPLTTAFDELFERYNKQLEEVRGRYREFYSDFRRILGDLETRGLGTSQIRGLLDRETLQPAFELMTEFEGRLKRLSSAGKLNWKDILGVEILKRIEPDISFDYAAELTKELFMQAGILERAKKAFVGDIVLFTEEIDDQFNIAGRQGVLRYREGLGFFVEAVDRELRTVKELPFDAVKTFVDSVFPARRIADVLDENIDILREHLVGAAAGMVAIGDKEFKRLYGMGPRFFEQIPTETLIQTAQGFNIGAGGAGDRGFGEVPFKAEFAGGLGFKNVIRDYFVKPEEELTKLVEEAKRRLEAQRGFAKGFEADIQRLANVIKNNQVVIQYMALFVDLNKTLAESTRVLQENIAVERERNEHLVETAGLLAGVPEAFTDINLGIRNFFELTAQQRQLVLERNLPPEQREFTRLRGQIGTEEIRRGSLAGELERVASTIIQAGFIRQQAQAAGVVVPKEDLMSITDVIRDISPGERKQIDLQKEIKENTAATVEGLNDMLAAAGDPKAQARNIQVAQSMGKGLAADINLLKDPRVIDKISAAMGFQTLERTIETQFDDLIKLRNLAEKRGNRETMAALDNIMEEQSRSLIDAVGIRRARGILEPAEGTGLERMVRGITETIGGRRRPAIQFMQGQFTFEDLISRSLGGEGLREVIQRMEAAAEPTEREKRIAEEARILKAAPIVYTGPGPDLETSRYRALTGSPEFRNLNKLMNEQNKISVTDSKTLGKLFAAYGAFNDIQRRAARREERGYDVQVMQLRQQQKGVVVKFKAGEIDREDFQTQMGDLAREIKETLGKRKEAGATAQRRATQEAVGLIASATNTFARAAGFSETALSALGKTAAGSIVAWHAWSALTGETLPESVRNATSAMNEWAKTMGSAGEDVGSFQKVLFGIGKTTGVGLGAAGRAGVAVKGVEEMAETQKSILTEAEKDKIRKMKDVQVGEDQVNKADEILKGIKEGDVKKTAEGEKILGINQDQLTTLIAIEENTRKASEGAEAGAKAGEGAAKETADEMKKPVESMSKNLRAKLDELKKARLLEGGDLATKIKDLFLAATVVTAAGYLGTKTQLPAELGEARRRAEKLSGAFAELAKKFPQEVEGAIRELKARREEALKPKPGEGKTEERSRLLDAEAAYQEFVAKLTTMAEGIGMAIDESTNIIGAAKDRAAVIIDYGSTIRESIEDFAKQIALGSKNLETEMRFRTGLSGAMKGLPAFEELPVGKLPHELTPTERLMKEGGPGYKQLYASFQALQQMREGLIGLMQQNSERMIDSQVSYQQDTVGLRRTIKSSREQMEKEGALGLLKEDPTKLVEMRRKEEKRIKQLQEVGRESIRRYKGIELPKPEEVEGWFVNPIKWWMNALGMGAEKAEEEAKKKGKGLFEKAGDAINRFGRDLYPELYAGIEDAEDISKRKQAQSLGAINKLSKNSRQLVDQYTKALSLVDLRKAIEAQKERVSRLKEISKEITKAYREEIEGAGRGEGEVPEVYAKTITKVNKRLIEAKGILSELEEAGAPVGSFREAVADLAQRTSMAAEKLKIAAENNENLAKAGDKVNIMLQDLAQVFETGLNIERVIGEFEQMKFSLRVDDLHREFANLADDVLNRIRGGQAPGAPVWPTFAMVQAGVPQDQLFGQNRAEAQIAEIIGRQGRMPTVAELQEIRFNEMLQEKQIKQAREDDKLREQISAVSNLDKQVIQAQLRTATITDPQVRGALVGAYDDLRTQLGTLVERSTERVEEIEPDVFERRGIPFEEIEAALRDFRDQFIQLPGMEEFAKQFDVAEVLRKMRLGEMAPVVDAIEQSNQILNAIETNTMGIVEKLVPGFMRREHREAVGSAAGDIVSAIRGETAPTAAVFGMAGVRQTGGTITGPGGPKEDRVPIFASPGEYVIRASSAGKVGKQMLDYINATGQVPGFQSGGSADEKKKTIGEKINFGNPPVVKEWIKKIKEFFGFAEGGDFSPPEGYRAAYEYFTNEKAPEPDWSPNTAKWIIQGISSRYEGTEYDLNAYDVSEALRRAESWKKFYNLMLDFSDQSETYEDFIDDVFDTFPRPSRKRGRTLRNLLPQELEEHFKDKFGGGMIRKKFPLGGLIPYQRFADGGGQPGPTLEAEKKLIESKHPIISGILKKQQAYAAGELRQNPFLERLYQGIGETIVPFHGTTAGMSFEQKSQHKMNQAALMADLAIGFIESFAAKALAKRTLSAILPKTGVKAEFDTAAWRKTRDLLSSQMGLPQYQQGTPFVPEDQLAVLHRGEAVIPAGGVDPAKVLQGIESAAEKFGEVVVQKLEDATINFNIPSSEEMPELKIDTSNLEGVLEGFSVGATGISKIDQFIESTTEKLDRLEEQTITNSEGIKIIEVKSSELDELEGELQTLKGEIETAYLKPSQATDSVEERSYVDSRINEAFGDLKSTDMVPLRSRMTSLELAISSLDRRLEEQRDAMYSNINRQDLR